MENNNQHIDYTDLIVRVLAGEATATEQKQLDEARRADKEVAGLYDEYSKIWDTLGTIKHLPEIDVNREWDIFLKKTFEEKPEDSKIIPIEKNSIRNPFRAVMKYAAVLLLGILTATGVYYAVNQIGYEKITAGEETKNITLPDGSEITLNVHSTVKFSKKLASGNVRKVNMQGDAHFDVATDKTKPFLIDVGEIIVEVKGTSFYVDAKNETISVIVESGSVAVYRPSGKDHSLMLKPGEKCTFSTTNKQLDKTTSINENYLSWKTKTLTFRNKPLEQVVYDISKTYHKEIVIKDESIKQCRYSATFEDETLDNILKILQSTLELEVSKTNEQIVLTGKGC